MRRKVGTQRVGRGEGNGKETEKVYNRCDGMNLQIWNDAKRCVGVVEGGGCGGVGRRDLAVCTITKSVLAYLGYT